MNVMMVVLALTAGLTTTKDSAPQWLNDYRAAQLRVAEVGKPMAVFIGSGKSGWDGVVREGSLDRAASKLLAERFVCLYIDTDTATGRSLAGAFDVAGRGLVISDATGSAQAYSHVGDLPEAELVKALGKYAEADQVARTTESVGHVEKPAPLAAPARTYPPQYRVAPTYTSGST